MSETKYTPGPWEAECVHYSSEFDIYAQPGEILIASVSGIEIDSPDEANARLIAAAPELLEALENLMKLVIPGGEFLYVREHGLPMTNGHQDIIDRAYTDAHAAIRKAKLLADYGRAERLKAYEGACKIVCPMCAADVQIDSRYGVFMHIQDGSGSECHACAIRQKMQELKK